MIKVLISFLLFWDHKIFFAINGLAESAPPFFAWVTEFGNISVLLIVIGACLAVWDRRGFFKKFSWLCIAIVSAWGLGQTLKMAVHRPRPAVYFADGVHQGKIVIHTLSDLYRSRTSFPSGHAIVVFAAATALCMLYGRRFWFLYIPATLIALSRVYVGAHFPSDTAAGAVIGTVVALGCGLFLDKKK